MLTDTGKELSSKELWLRAAIALAAMAVVFLVGNYVFNIRVQQSVQQMQQAIEADKAGRAGARE